MSEVAVTELDLLKHEGKGREFNVGWTIDNAIFYYCAVGGCRNTVVGNVDAELEQELGDNEKRRETDSEENTCDKNT